MKTTTIKVTFSSDDFRAAITEFVRYIHQVNTETPEKVIFDLSQCSFFVPYILAGITAIAKFLADKHCTIEYIFPPDKTYLETINFPNGIDFSNILPEEIESRLGRFNAKTYLPVICFPAKNNETHIREKVMSTVNSILRNQLQLQGNILQAIYYMIDELTQNVVDHSDAPNGVVFAQYFSRKHYMDLCISDCGKGVYRAYLDSGKHNPANNTEALEFAVKGKSVKDLPDSRGFGLSTSRKMLVHGLKGTFFVLSGDTFFLEEPEQQEKIIQLADLDYQGCFVALRIPLNTTGFDFYKYVE